MNRKKPIDHARFVKWVSVGLILALCLKITGFFTISESISITRVLKVIIRLSSTGIVAAIYLLLISRGFQPRFKIVGSLSPLLYFAYILLGFISLLWSSNPIYSGLQLFMTTETIIFVYWMVSICFMINYHLPNHQIKIGNIISLSILPILLVFIIGKFVAPDTFFRLTHGGEVARLGGYLMNPNELGMLAVVGIGTGFLHFNSRNKLVSTLIIGLMVYALLLTSSRSSLIGLALILTLLTFSSKKIWLKTAFVVLAIIAAPILFNNIILKEGDMQEVLSMTGRIPFWKALINEGLVKAPWFGFGFMRIAEGDYFISVNSYAARMTHNTFVQVLMNLGFVGFTLITAQLGALINSFFKCSNKYLKEIFLIIFLPIFINSLTEFGIFGENNFGILFYQILIIMLCVIYVPQHSINQRLIAKAKTKYYFQS